MKKQHTPGPWEIVGSNVFSRNGWKDIPIASPCMNPGIEQSKANAHLIASAPDLLEALKALHSCHRAFSQNENWTTLDDEARKFAEAAIAKAEGAE